MPTALIPLSILAACGPPSEEAVDSGATPAPWQDPAADDDWDAHIDQGGESGRWTADTVGAAVDRGLAGGLPELSSLVQRYESLLAMGDEECPGSAFNGGFAVASVCESTAGVSYSGASGLDRMDDSIGTGEGWTGIRQVRSGPADYAITDIDGDTLAAGGVYQHVASRTDIVSWMMEIRGTFSDPGGADWLSRGFSGDVRLVVVERTPGDAQLEASGGMTAGSDSLRFDGVTIAPARCPDGVPRGQISVRQAAGRWFALSFVDGCSPCGRVTDPDGVDIGEACIDPTPLFDAIPRTQVEP